MNLKDLRAIIGKSDRITDNISRFDDSTLGKITDMSIKNDQALLQIDASHSGIVNGNGMFYSPRKMKDGVVSFTKPYKIPILVNHDTNVDPLGRVVKAEYADFTKSYKDNHLTALVSAVMKNRSKDEVHNQHAAELFKYLRDKGMLAAYGNTYSGLGATRIYMNVTDWQAVEKIKDGRYDTMSVSFSRGDLWCMDCNNYFTSDACSHSWSDDNVLMPDSHKYMEVSYVNVPADVLAKMSNEQNYHELAMATMSDSVSRKMVGDKESNIITINTGINSFEDSEVSTDEQIELENNTEANLQDEDDMKPKDKQQEPAAATEPVVNDGAATEPVVEDKAPTEPATTEPAAATEPVTDTAPATEVEKPALFDILNKDSYAKAVNSFIEAAKEEDKARLSAGLIDLTQLDSLTGVGPENSFIVTNSVQAEIALALLDSHEAKTRDKNKIKKRIEAAKTELEKVADAAAQTQQQDSQSQSASTEFNIETIDSLSKEIKQTIFNKLFAECSVDNKEVKLMKQEIVLLGLETDSFKDESNEFEVKYTELLAKVKPLIVDSIVTSEIRLGKADKSEYDAKISSYNETQLDELLVKFDFFSKIEDNNIDNSDATVVSDEGNKGNSQDSSEPNAQTQEKDAVPQLTTKDTKTIKKPLAVKTNIEEAKLLRGWEKVFKE